MSTSLHLRPRCTMCVLGCWGWGGDVSTSLHLRPRCTMCLNRCKAFDQLKSTCVLITDGAPVYPGISKTYGIKHFACNHSRGIFNLKKRYKNKVIDCHAGGIDGCWKLCKSSIPAGLSSKKTVNLMKHARIWQWRWHHRQTSLALALGKVLADF